MHCKTSEFDGHDNRMSCYQRGPHDLKYTPRLPRMTTTLAPLRLARSLQAATKALNARALASAAAEPASAAEADAELVRRDADPAAAVPGPQQAATLMQDRITVDGRFISSPLPAPEAPLQPPNTTPRLSAYAPQVPPISDEVCTHGAEQLIADLKRSVWLAKSHNGCDQSQALRFLVDFLQANRNVVALTGAGVSTESSIPDYRGPRGAYSTGFKPMTHQQVLPCDSRPPQHLCPHDGCCTSASSGLRSAIWNQNARASLRLR